MVDILEKLISLEKLGSNPKVGYFQYFFTKKISGLKCNPKKKKKQKQNKWSLSQFQVNLVKPPNLVQSSRQKLI